MKDTGKSSSRKLRRVIYYILYRMDPQKTHYKNSFSANIFKIKFFEIVRLYFPPYDEGLHSGVDSLKAAAMLPSGPLTSFGRCRATW